MPYNPYVMDSTQGGYQSPASGGTTATTPAQSYGNNYSSALGAGGFTAIGGALAPLTGGISVAVGAGLDLIAGIFGASSKRKEEKRQEQRQIDNANIDKNNQWQAYEDRRNKMMDSPEYHNAMLNASRQSWANIGSPVLARPDAYDYLDVQEQIAQQGG